MVGSAAAATPAAASTTPPPPPPPTPPPPPPPTKTFIVFFDFNKSNLTSEAQAVVQEAVKVAKDNGFVRVLITGHTDTVGSDSYNQALSVRRAQSVKDEMTARRHGRLAESRSKARASTIRSCRPVQASANRKTAAPLSIWVAEANLGITAQEQGRARKSPPLFYLA